MSAERRDGDAIKEVSPHVVSLVSWQQPGELVLHSGAQCMHACINYQTWVGALDYNSDQFGSLSAAALPFRYP